MKDANSLQGSILTQIAKLDLWQYIDMFGNSIAGTLPTQLGSLSKLWSCGRWTSTATSSTAKLVGQHIVSK